MKLSKLRSLCDKAIAKYGDMNVGTYGKDYAYGVENENDMHDFKFRILSSTGIRIPSSTRKLPGETIDDDEESSKSPAGHYACIFYED